MDVVITVVWGEKSLKTDINTKKKLSFLKQNLVRQHGLDRTYRLFFQGNELDEKPLDQQGVQAGSVIIVVPPAGFSMSGPQLANKRQEVGYMPPELQGLQSHLLLNPEIMHQMLQSPAMQHLLNDPSLLENVMKMNPATRASLESNPEFAEIMSETTFMDEARAVFRSPNALRDMLTTTETAISELRGMPGGIDVVMNMDQQINEDADEEMMEEAADAELTGIRPAWHTACDPNAMASMMQDPNLQSLMAQFIDATARKPNTCFSNPAFIATLFKPQTMQAMSSMESAKDALKSTRSRSKDASNAEAAANPNASPASTFTKSYELFLDAQRENPENKYRVQLAKMRNMGFKDLQKNVLALNETEGHVQRAIDFLLKQG